MHTARHQESLKKPYSPPSFQQVAYRLGIASNPARARSPITNVTILTPRACWISISTSSSSKTPNINCQLDVPEKRTYIRQWPKERVKNITLPSNSFTQTNLSQDVSGTYFGTYFGDFPLAVMRCDGFERILLRDAIRRFVMDRLFKGVLAGQPNTD